MIQKKKRNNEESRIQAACVKWFRLQYPKLQRLIFSVPNGAVLKGKPEERAIQMRIVKSEGLVPGVADIFLSVPSCDLCGLYIETKTKKGEQSDNQKLFELDAVAQGYGYVIVRSIDEFMNAVRKYFDRGEY